MAIDSFAHAAALEPEALRALLDQGRPEERVWAIWALALRLGEGAVEAGRRVDREPDAGVRRTLAIVCAGHGDTELLVALARHDPELVVRQTAIQLATRLVAGGALDPGILFEASTAEPAIRIAMLGAIGAGAPDLLVAIALRQLEAREVEVRLEAFEALVRIETRPTREAARAFLLALPDIAIACERWLAAASVESLAEALVGAPAATRARVLRQVHAPPWAAVALLIGDDLDELRYVLWRADIAVPARVLARAILSGTHQGFVDRLIAQLEVASHGHALLADLRIAAELDLDDGGALLRALAGRARRFAVALEVSDGGDVLDELAGLHPVEHLIGLENAVARWVDASAAPRELVPVLAELEAYCRRRLAVLDTVAPALPRRRGGRELPALRSGDDDLPVQVRPWDERARFRELVEVLGRLTSTNRGGSG